MRVGGIPTATPCWFCLPACIAPPLVIPNLVVLCGVRFFGAAAKAVGSSLGTRARARVTGWREGLAARGFLLPYVCCTSRHMPSGSLTGVELPAGTYFHAGLVLVNE